jgi:hypothetical protein
MYVAGENKRAIEPKRRGRWLSTNLHKNINALFDFYLPKLDTLNIV